MVKKKILYICTDPALGMLPYASKIINTIGANNDSIEIFGVFVCKNNDSYKNFIEERFQNKNTLFIEASQGLILSFLDKIYPIKIINAINTICINNNIDIIHCLTTEFCLGYYLHRIQRKINVIYTVHDLHPHEEFTKSLKSKIVSKIIKRGVSNNIKRISILTTSSKAQYKQLINYFPNKRIFLQPFPTLVTKRMIEGNAISPELAKINKYILFFGTINPYKGVELLYNVFIDNDHINRNYHLVIAGKGEWYFKRNLENENKIIRINRFIDDNEIKHLFKNAACVVYPYLSATQSGVLSLAYYFGTPLVTSDIPFFLENVEADKTALVFENGNSDSLKNTIESALESKMNTNLIFHQLGTYDKLYSEISLTNSLIETYKIVNII